MKRIAVTGGIATGKSIVCKFFGELGFPIISSDDIAREITKKGGKGYIEVVKAFGNGILTEKGEIDRKKLGEIVFSDPEKRKILEGILHPIIREESENRYREIERQNPCTKVIFEIPLLFEAAQEVRFDVIIVVYAPREVQIKRLMERDGFTYEYAMKRLVSQIDIEEKVKKAHYVIDNSKDLEYTKKQVLEIASILKSF